MTTKERILYEALNLFSVRGFEPVAVRDIAGAVGIKESSLYNHFKNKQDIFDTIIQEYAGRWEQIFSDAKLTGEDKQFIVDERTVNMYKNMTFEQFAAATEQIFIYYMTDDINVKLRKMLTIEQFRNPEIGQIYRAVSFEDSISFQAQLFSALIAAGALKPADPYILALEFFSPIFLLFYKFGGAENLDEAKALFKRHLEHFNQTYGVKTEG
jgi:AcrR family transcriptional regulator